MDPDQIRCYSIHEVPHVPSDPTSRDEHGDLMLNLRPDVPFNLCGYPIRIAGLPRLEIIRQDSDLSHEIGGA
ncbi:hypothetical protein GCM10009608_46540 [Pseudonocardia alaniniphila]